MNQPDVRIMEVGPRDGLQNEKQQLTTTQKMAFIRRLADAGVSQIEATAFVPAKLIPQMADHSSIIEQTHDLNNVDIYALVSSEVGLQNAIAAGVTHISLLASCSEAFSQHNTRCSVHEGLARIERIMPQAQSKHLGSRAYISCALGCPYNETIKLSTIEQIAARCMAAGCQQIVIADTTGQGSPKRMRDIIRCLTATIDPKHIAVHCHDTYGQAIANIYTALEMGIRNIDSAAGGLGGCPYAPGAGGNVATEDVLFLCHGLGLSTEINPDIVAEAGNNICKLLGTKTRSKVAQAMACRVD